MRNVLLVLLLDFFELLCVLLSLLLSRHIPLHLQTPRHLALHFVVSLRAMPDLIQFLSSGLDLI